MKKIGIITIHTDFNYGAVLQAVATQRIFELNGYDSEIIDYENKVIAEQARITYKQDGRFLGYLKTFIRNTIFGRYWYYKQATKDLDQYRKKSTKKYRNLDELSDCPYDILIVGSDQLWNSDISRGLDSAFLLDFCSGKKKISFATSMGSRPLNEAERAIFKRVLSEFSSISVREDFAKKQLIGLVDKNIKVLLDPTLMISRSIWMADYGTKSRFAEKKEKYILTYFVSGNKKRYKSAVASYAKKMNMPVWTLQYSNYTWKESDKKILGASIIDFIALIANADLVITDSFHGVAFSINMGTNFVALDNSMNPIRVREFLDKLGLGNRINMEINQYVDVDYGKVDLKLEFLRRDSIDWVLKAVE